MISSPESRENRSSTSAAEKGPMPLKWPLTGQRVFSGLIFGRTFYARQGRKLWTLVSRASAFLQPRQRDLRTLSFLGTPSSTSRTLLKSYVLWTLSCRLQAKYSSVSDQPGITHWEGICFLFFRGRT